MAASFSFEILKLRKRPAVWVLGAILVFMGAFLALLFQVTALVIGLGLVYGLAIENLIFGFSDQSRIIEALTDVLLIKNGGDLANSLGEVPRAFSSQDPTEPAQAALVLGRYVIGLLLIAALLFRRRDVT
jgi:ABC-type transport system involved in multi-copper enzyme maturation permease subunit